jgi:hypothetical protein
MSATMGKKEKERKKKKAGTLFVHKLMTGTIKME